MASEQQDQTCQRIFLEMGWRVTTIIVSKDLHHFCITGLMMDLHHRTFFFIKNFPKVDLLFCEWVGVLSLVWIFMGLRAFSLYGVSLKTYTRPIGSGVNFGRAPSPFFYFYNISVPLFTFTWPLGGPDWQLNGSGGHTSMVIRRSLAS